MNNTDIERIIFDKCAEINAILIPMVGNSWFNFDVHQVSEELVSNTSSHISNIFPSIDEIL